MSPETVTNTSLVEARERIVLGRRIINFMGPEGSGKTTIAKKLATETGKPLIIFGDIFRHLAETDQGPHGDECRAVFREHRYIDSRILFEIMVERFKQEDLADGFIIDGGMRKAEEIQRFPEMLEAANRIMPITNILLRVPGWLGVNRLTQDPTKRGRVDDTASATLSRLSRYYYELGKRASLIRQQPNWKLEIVNGIGSPEEVFDRVCKELAAKPSSPFHWAFHRLRLPFSLPEYRSPKPR